MDYRRRVEVTRMLPDALREPALTLFSICATAVMLDALVADSRGERPFRALCALAASVCALRALLRALGGG